MLTDQQLTQLGFKLLPMVTDECDDDFAYRIAEIRTPIVLIEVVNEYREKKLTAQFLNYEVEADSQPVDVELIKKLKNVNI